MLTEHKAVLDSFKQLEKEGFEVTYLQPERSGLLNLNKLKENLREDTIFVSIMHANNEIGVVQDICQIGQLLKERGILFHVDAAQSAGKLPINLAELPVDMMSFSAHKNYGPKGIGALFVRQKPRVRLLPITYGGGHESGMRSGTLPTHQIAGMGEAFVLSNKLRETEQARILKFREKLWSGIKHLPGIQLNGHPDQRLAGNLNISFAGLEGEKLLVHLNKLAISTTSACSSASTNPSYVLKAIGLDDFLAYSTIRLSIGRFTTEENIDFAVKEICRAVSYLHKSSHIEV